MITKSLGGSSFPEISYIIGGEERNEFFAPSLRSRMLSLGPKRVGDGLRGIGNRVGARGGTQYEMISRPDSTIVRSPW